METQNTEHASEPAQSPRPAPEHYSLPSFFDWYVEREYPDETPPRHTGWIREFASKFAWAGYRTGDAIHDGDCVNMP